MWLRRLNGISSTVAVMASLVLTALMITLRELLAQYRIGLAHALKPVTGDRSQAPYSKPRSRERLTIDHAIRQAEGLSHYPYLVLIEELQRLD